jgi:hypothetical protein
MFQMAMLKAPANSSRQRTSLGTCSDSPRSREMTNMVQTAMLKLMARKLHGPKSRKATATMIQLKPQTRVSTPSNTSARVGMWAAVMTRRRGMSACDGD